jgi:hypothetical protein
LAGICTTWLALPSLQGTVAGSPTTGLLADRVHVLAPDTDADTVVVPADTTFAGLAVRFVITGGLSALAAVALVQAHRIAIATVARTPHLLVRA